MNINYFPIILGSDLAGFNIKQKIQMFTWQYMQLKPEHFKCLYGNYDDY